MARNLASASARFSECKENKQKFAIKKGQLFAPQKIKYFFA